MRSWVRRNRAGRAALEPARRMDGILWAGVKRARDATCLINSRSSVLWPAEVLRQLPKLKMFAICGIGTDAIDLNVAREQGIDVRNLPGRTAPIVAEHAIGLLLAISKRAWFQTNELKQGRWTGMQNIYLRG